MNKLFIFKSHQVLLTALFLFLITSNTSMVVFAKDTVTFAMLPQMANTKIYKKWKPLLNYIEKNSGVKIEHLFPKDFDEHVQWCRKGKIDIAYSNPVTYCQIAKKAKVRKHGHDAIAVAETTNGTKDFYGLFIARDDNNKIKKLEDLKGKNGWIVGWSSAAGYTFQEAHAIKNGINLKNDCNLTVSPDNKQEKVIMAVFNRETDFGCIRNGMLEMVKVRVDTNQLKVVAETTHHPAWTISISDKLKPSMAKKLKTVILNLPEEMVKDSALPGNVIAFTEANDATFDSIRTVLDTVKQDY